MIEKPALLGQPAAVPDQRAVFAHDPVAGDEDREVVGRDEPADLPRVQTGCARDIVVGAGFAQGNLPQRLVPRDLGGREI